jgi:hypothetical protein
MSNTTELKKLADFLNSLLALDNKSITYLFNKRVITTSEKLINHTKIPVAEATKSKFNEDGELLEEKPFYQLGILGLLNGYFYNDEYILAAVYDSNYKGGIIIKKFDVINLKEIKQNDQDSD